MTPDTASLAEPIAEPLTVPFDDLFWRDEYEPITESDTELAGFVEQADMPALLAALAAALGDPSLLADELRPPLTLVDTYAQPHGGMTATQVDHARAVAFEALKRLRDRDIRSVGVLPSGQVDAIPHYDLNAGTPLGNFIGPGVGGLNSPFDILFRANDVLVASIDSDNILRYDLSGTPLGVFATNIPFGEQMCIAQNGNILVAEFTRNAIIELTPAGAEIAALAVSGPRGCYELANGNILTTNSAGVHEVDRVNGGIVSTKLPGVGARFIEKVDLAGVTSVEPTTWGRIKSQFQGR